MSIVIFGDRFTFPDGNAATNRIHTYAKGFLENSISVHVICFASEYDTAGDGIIDGIFYYHPFGQRKRSKYFIVRRWQKFIKYYTTFRLIKEINRSDKVIAINSWTQLLLSQLFIFLITKYLKTNVISEHSEHPLRNYQGSSIRRIQGEIISYLGTILSDGIFCISKYLLEFYKTRGVNLKKLFLVPSTVDTSRFRTVYNSPLTFQYILYCGGLTVLKDGVDILIESFARIVKKYPDLNLVLIGEVELDKKKDIFKDLVTSLDISNRVFFLGHLSRTDVPAYLTHAKILALARPRSIVADAGFPSKLTEYLATGVPVVVTAVGDIPIYLRDHENAFLSKPDNVDEFADKMEYVLDNYKLAREVASKGQELTNTVFNYNFQAKRMIDFIYSL